MRPVSFVVLLALTLAGSAITADSVTFSLPRPIVWFDAARPELDITIDARVPASAAPPRSEPAEKESATPPEELPTVADVTPAPAPNTAAIAVKAVEVRAVPLADKTMRRWRVRAVVPTYPAGVNTVERKLKVTWGNYVSPDLTYWLTSATAASLNWKAIGLPTEWSAKGSWCLPMRLAVGGQRATGILVTSRLVEQSTKRPMAPRLFLSLDDKKPAEASSRALETAVNDRGEPVYLCADAANAMPGKYQGSITISTAEKPDAEAIAATVYTTTNGAISLGIVLLAFGSILAFFARVLAPARLQRSQALLPAALVRERAAKVATRLTDVVARATFLPSATLEALRAFNTDLADSVLEAANMVPKQFPSPFVFALDTTGYRALLDKATERLGKLDVLVDGFARAMKLGDGNPLLADSLTGLDALAPTIDQQTLEQVRIAVESKLQPLRPAALADAIAAPESPVRDTETLLLDIRWTSGFVWATSTALTFIVGLFYLVLQNPAFGVPMDFLFCFGWGFGLPTAAGQLTSASAREALGVTLPKVSA